MKEFYDLWVNHQLRHCPKIASALWVISTTDQERRGVVNQFCEGWVKHLSPIDWDMDKCFGDLDIYLESAKCRC